MHSFRPLFFCLLTLTPALAWGPVGNTQSALENPHHKSNQPGVSAITGWICNGVNSGIRFNGVGESDVQTE